MVWALKSWRKRHPTYGDPYCDGTNVVAVDDTTCQLAWKAKSGSGAHPRHGYCPGGVIPKEGAHGLNCQSNSGYRLIRSSESANRTHLRLDGDMVYSFYPDDKVLQARENCRREYGGRDGRAAMMCQMGVQEAYEMNDDTNWSSDDWKAFGDGASKYSYLKGR